MGCNDGPQSRVIYYQTATRRLHERQDDRVTILNESIFDYLEKALSAWRVPSELPFDFNCGFVGYFGYQLKHECGSREGHADDMPDAAFIFADRLMAFDHQERCIYLVTLDEDETRRTAWFNHMADRLQNPQPLPPLELPHRKGTVPFRLDRSQNRYLDDIGRCLGKIHQGESYEVCLTNQVRCEPVDDPLTLYRVLRRQNPAPYSAWFKFGEHAILCSSPEQFLKIGPDRTATARPIKGTVARHRDPECDRKAAEGLAASEKDRAENLMIVDLLRNDLGRVCEIDSVQVPHLMTIESFATVHQMVSTVRGQLREDRSSIDCIRASFPGGSMTGAPKLRTMEIIDSLERRARGVYSGSLGFLGLNGTADLNIVIRTAINTPRSLSIGTGGAIVNLSDPQAEFDEILIKAAALIRATAVALNGNLDPEELILIDQEGNEDEAATRLIRQLCRETMVSKIGPVSHPASSTPSDS